MSVSPSGFCRYQRKAWESNPHDPKVARFSKPARRAVSGYLPKLLQWTHRESNPDYRHAIAVSSRWTMSPFFSSGPHGSRTHHTDLARVSRPRRHAGPFIAEVRPGVEPGLRPYHGRVPPKTLTDQYSHPGWNRTSTFLVVTQTSLPLDTGSDAVTEVGIEPTESHILDLIALPVCVPDHVSSGSGSRTRLVQAYEARTGHCRTLQSLQS